MLDEQGAGVSRSESASDLQRSTIPTEEEGMTRTNSHCRIKSLLSNPVPFFKLSSRISFPWVANRIKEG